MQIKKYTKVPEYGYLTTIYFQNTNLFFKIFYEKNHFRVLCSNGKDGFYEMALRSFDNVFRLDLPFFVFKLPVVGTFLFNHVLQRLLYDLGEVVSGVVFSPQGQIKRYLVL